jgi:dTDP-4-amino-4,6-dideoxygalactose transaminase
MRNTSLRLPVEAEGCESAWHLFVVRSRDRDALQKELARRGVDTAVHYPVAPHLQPAYADMGLGRGAFPISEAIHDEVLSLPIGPHLSDEEADYVIAAVNQAA